MNLYINCCARDESRTDILARAVIENVGGDFEELALYNEKLQPLDKKRLAKRTELAASGDFSDDMFRYAKQFASAEKIVISAPYWDLSFPSVLKLYIENIYVIGVVTDYDERGVPFGMCRAKKLYYVTTAGGPLNPAFGYGYIESLAKDYFGIPETQLVKAEMLDIPGYDAEAILNKEISKWL